MFDDEFAFKTQNKEKARRDELFANQSRTPSTAAFPFRESDKCNRRHKTSESFEILTKGYSPRLFGKLNFQSNALLFHARSALHHWSKSNHIIARFSDRSEEIRMKNTHLINIITAEKTAYHIRYNQLDFARSSNIRANKIARNR